MGNLIWREHDKQWACTKIKEKHKPQNPPKEKTSLLITDLHIKVHIYWNNYFYKSFELASQNFNFAFTESELIFFFKLILCEMWVQATLEHIVYIFQYQYW